MFYLTAVPIVPNASGTVRRTDVMFNVSDWWVQKKPRRAFSSDFRIDSIFPGSGGCFCSVGIYHLCSRGDHIQSQRMSCRYHDIDRKYLFLDILAQTNVLPFTFPLLVLGAKLLAVRNCAALHKCNCLKLCFNVLTCCFCGYSIEFTF